MIKMPLRYDGLSNRSKFLFFIKIVDQGDIGRKTKFNLRNKATAVKQEKPNKDISQRFHK